MLPGRMGFSVLVVVVSCSGPKQACGLGRLGFCVGSVAAGVVRARNPRLVARGSLYGSRPQPGIVCGLDNGKLPPTHPFAFGGRKEEHMP